MLFIGHAALDVDFLLVWCRLALRPDMLALTNAFGKRCLRELQDEQPDIDGAAVVGLRT